MELFDKSSDIITQGSGKSNKNGKQKIRKGAMMGILSCWHPDIKEFITAKQHGNNLSKFNISVNLTDEFIKRVRNDEFNTFEGVVCKGTERLGSYRGKVWMSKIKTLKYLDLLKLRKGSDFNKFWE
jgi:ribonucleotide reductase alpha subunit